MQKFEYFCTRISLYAVSIDIDSEGLINGGEPLLLLFGLFVGALLLKCMR